MNFFDRVYCICHPQCGRRDDIGAELARVGITDVQYVYANRPVGRFHMSNMRRAPAAEFGVNLSHIKAVVHAIADGAERPLFVEDDIVFLPGGVKRLELALKSLPDDWDVLYLGGHPCGDVFTFAEALVEVGRFSFAEAYAISGPALQRFHGYWCDRIGQPHAMYDRILGEFAEASKAFSVYPVITEQPPGYSHVAKKNDDKRNLILKGWLQNRPCVPSKGRGDAAVL